MYFIYFQGEYEICELFCLLYGGVVWELLVFALSCGMNFNGST